jgi:hypothetical protein
MVGIDNNDRDVVTTPDDTRVVYASGSGLSAQVFVRPLDALERGQVGMVAAHLGDLRAAKAEGLRTAVVVRAARVRPDPDTRPDARRVGRHLSEGLQRIWLPNAERRRHRRVMMSLLLPVAVAAVVVGASCAGAPDERVDPDDGSRWWQHVAYLASDDLEGRSTGSDGYRKAAAYVAEQFQSLGLQPAGTSGYLQPIAFQTRQLIPEKSSVEIVRDGRVEVFKIPEEVFLSLPGGSGALIEAPLVFAGYGLTIPEANHDDFAGLPTDGAVAIIMEGAPKSVPSLLAAHHRSLEEIVRNAVRLGLRGFVGLPPTDLEIPWDQLVNRLRPLATAMRAPVPGIVDVWYMGPFVVLRPEVGDRVLAGSGLSFRELSALVKDRRPLPHVAMRSTIRIQPAFESGTAESSNVVAVLQGSDPVLRDEYVVLSAHLDHIGVGAPVGGDHIYNGAMDNAIGVATLLQVARLLQSGSALKRSVLFLAVTGEEKGLQGSRYFAERPTVPLQNIVANVNIDAYLPLFPLEQVRGYGLQESDLAGHLEAAARQHDLRVQDDPTPDRNFIIASDQYSFVKKGIPALLVDFGYDLGTPQHKAVTAWVEQRYHSPADDVSQPVDKAAAARFNRVIATLTDRIANASRRPEWREESFFRRFAQ